MPSTPKVQSPLVPTLETQKSWNTKNLGLRIAADGASAATAGALIAPVITMIDKAIIENASGRAALLPSLKSSFITLLTRPHTFLISKPFALIFALYTGTYMTANTLDTTKSTLNSTPASATTSGVSKFAATSTANLSLCLYKDSQFTRLFAAANSAPKPVPGVTYALFAARDMLTIFASFNLPPVVAPLLPLTPKMEEYVSRLSTAQFLAPAALQLASTPLHLLGLDLYNREGVSAADRWKKVRSGWLGSSFARMGRIVPAFGVGGVVNTRVRATLMEKLE